MIGFLTRLLARGEPALSEATPRDAIAIAPARRGRGLSRRLLDLHLRRLAGIGMRRVFLEVDEDNMPARRLYARAGFRDVGRREAYYQERPGRSAAALVLRRDL